MFAVSVFDVDNKKNRIVFLQEQLTLPEVYANISLSTKYNKELCAMISDIEIFENLKEELEFLEFGLLDAKIDDETTINFLIEKSGELNKSADKFYLSTLLSGEFDKNNAIIKIHSGAGGTESCDWVSMVFRMYTMWAKSQGYKVEVLDSLDGDEAGLKSVTFSVTGYKAYGYLKSEIGVHRLVRISPFDSNKRRHTSFLSVEVMPEIEDDNQIEIKADEIKVDTYRASGAGGQHVNTTDSAIRITHLKTGVVVTCQNERSQIKNKETALKVLKSKLLAIKEEERQKQLSLIKGDIKKIEWGSQIRSYVFCPYTMVNDHRTGFKSADVDGAMNGNIGAFMLEYLKWINK